MKKSVIYLFLATLCFSFVFLIYFLLPQGVPSGFEGNFSRDDLREHKKFYESITFGSERLKIQQIHILEQKQERIADVFVLKVVQENTILMKKKFFAYLQKIASAKGMRVAFEEKERASLYRIYDQRQKPYLILEIHAKTPSQQSKKNQDKQCSLAFIFINQEKGRSEFLDILALSEQVTLGIITLSKNIQDTLKMLEKKRTPFILQVPMESKSQGNHKFLYTLVSSDTYQDIDHKIQENVIALDSSATFVSQYTGSAFLENKESVVAFVQILKERRLSFLDLKTSSKNNRDIFDAYGVKYKAIDKRIDGSANLKSVRQELENTLKSCKKAQRTRVIAVTPGRAGLQAVEQFLKNLPPFVVVEAVMQ